ncbi:vacuolar import and degradation protein-domain-containing protein [Geopyxis carbonaria]|nr:vacuolar import and degradation protein-domain-containing protein [Geopyxis carbonaria]
MPTPNETMAESLLVDDMRPSRPQLACPEEVITSTQSSTWEEVPRSNSGIATPCPSSEQLRLEQTASRLSTEDEKTPNASSRIAASALRRSLPTPKHLSQSIPSPTADQKTFSRRSLAHGRSVSTELPFVPSPNHDISTKRILPSYTSSFLRPGSKFVGKQTSERNTYEVAVELKHVDMADSFLCGYLRIKGLTEDHPTLTTYFEGEMIGDKHSFHTCRPEWGSCEKNDMGHWSQFASFREMKQFSEFNYANFAQNEHIYMRWKEYFLVPDHRVKQISGASFEGFYYICFNQVTGAVSGVYFHAKSEKFQKLELKHIPERTFGSMGLV